MLRSSIFFENDIITKEDKNRTLLYKQKTKRKKLFENIKNSKLSKDKWIKSLETELIINTINESSEYLGRVVQLFNRTNQFNLKSSKYEKSNFLKKLSLKNNTYYYGIVSDRIGSEGLVSVIGYKEEKKFICVSDFIISCRVFNRYIEELMLLPILKLAKKRKLGVTFEIKNSKRNKVSSSFVEKICDKSKCIQNKLISELINKYENFPVSIKVCKELKN